MKTIKKITGMMILAAVFTLTSVTPGLAGAVGGRQYNTYRLYGNSYNNFGVTFRGGEIARVYVNGDGSTDLDLYIYDQYGRLIVYDNDYSDSCFVKWFPIYTGTFTIQVVNRGGYCNIYRISTN
ncbi:MAG TPA: hypothetical protein VE262_04515 [Blastocatellia bacterium]|nr:hypothetical protein [Blastocatellia bacterium]